MRQRLATVAAFAQRVDGAIAVRFGSGSSADAWFARLAHRRSQAVTTARHWVAGRLPPPVVEGVTRIRDTLYRGLEFAASERTGLVAAVLVTVVGLFLTRALWTPLSWPASAVNAFIAPITPTTCNWTGPENFASDIACGMVLAVLTVSGALVAAGALLLFRLPLRRLAAAFFGAVTGPATFLVMPLVAVVMFTVGWAGVQYHFPERPGIVADGDFPAVIGLMTYALARYGPLAREHAAALFTWGNTMTAPVKLGLVMAVPFMVFTLTIPVLSTPVRDQVSVLASIAVAYVLFAPAVARRPERAT